MRTCGFLLSSLLLFLSSWSAPVQGAELLPPDRPIEEVIDYYINSQLASEEITPAPRAADATLIRRLTLDLAGRIPTLAEAQAFVKSTADDRTVQLVERLLASPDYPLHQRNEFDTLLLPNTNDNAWRDYLLEAFRENRPWDQLFRELMLTEETDEKNRAALAFLKKRAKDLDDLTNDTSSLFFGVSINCAKCHDHPLVLDWTQDHYYGMSSFFNRTYLNKRNQLGERDEGLVKFTTTEGEEKQAQLMFLTGAVVDEPPPPQISEEERKELEKKRKEDENQKEGPPPPAPAFSRRAKLVELALRSEDNYFFSRSIVNRIWARLMGYGLVMPLDQMHSQNPPSHPELLDWLARDLVTNGYDLRRLIRGIVLSEAYARSSRWEHGDPPSEKLFAVALPRPLTPRQFSLSLHFAAQNPDQFPLDMKAEEWAKRRDDFDRRSAGFANRLEVPNENFQVSVSEALLFSNSPSVQNDFLGEGNDRLVGKLKSLADHNEQIQTAFWAILSRSPEPEELETLHQYLTAREDRPAAALQQMVWALMTSSEARFNY